ncbi:MAG: hypothetical protein GXO70_03015 [Acidobacteria bacterium]|nr:hypothetical protein [Acidobacteriota bacterium]
MFKIPLKFRWTYRHLTSAELSKDCSFDLCLSNLFEDNTQRFLDFYSEQGLRLSLKRYGFVAKLREFGYEQVDIRFGVREDGSHYLVVFEPPFDKESVIAELVVRRTALDEIFPVLKVEWLCLQNPRASFSANKPKLPGQQYPGLGLGKDVLSAIILMALRLKYQAVINVADHFHNAYIYSGNFQFYKPEDAARFHDFCRFMEHEGFSLVDIAWALEKGKVFLKGEDTPYNWEPAVQILPLRSSLAEKYDSREYADVVESSNGKFQFEYRS